MSWIISAIIAVVLSFATSLYLEYRMEPEGRKAFFQRSLRFFPVYFAITLIIIHFIGFIF